MLDILIPIIESLFVGAIIVWALRTGILTLPRSDRRVQLLQAEVERLREIVAELQAENDCNNEIIKWLLKRVPRGDSPPPAAYMHRLPDVQPLERQLLLICANDEFCKADRNALLRARMEFRSVPVATRAGVIAEIRGRRQEGAMWRYIHIAADSNEEGVMLRDGVTGTEWWQDRIGGVEVLFLNGCKTHVLAASLAGIVDYVISISVEIENEDAGAFAYAFWRRMREGGRDADAKICFHGALGEVPRVREYVDIRHT